MIDLRALRENPEPFRASQRARGADVDLVDRVIAADETRRQALAAFENLRAEQKQVSRSVGKASPEERPAILANAKELAEQVKAAEAASSAAAAELDDLARQFANLIEGAPSGGEEDYVVLRHEGGEPRDFAHLQNGGELLAKIAASAPYDEKIRFLALLASAPSVRNSMGAYLNDNLALYEAIMEDDRNNAAFALAALAKIQPDLDEQQQQTYRNLRQRFGFNLDNVSVDNNQDKPQICAEFSDIVLAEPLQNWKQYISVTPAPEGEGRYAGDKLCYTGQWQTEYTFKIDPKLAAQNHMELGMAIERTVDTGDRAPMVRFATRGKTLVLDPEAALTIESSNVDAVELELWQIPDNNLAGDAHDAIDNPEYFNTYDLNNNASKIWTGSFEPEKSARNSVVQSRVAFADMAGKETRSGVYVLNVRAKDQYENALLGFTVTDQGLTAYQTPDGLLAELRDLRNNQPIAGQNVTLYAKNNRILGEAKTDAQGIARFSAAQTGGEDADAPGHLISQHDGHLAYLRVAGQEIDLSDKGLSGEAETNRTLTHWSWHDRGVYRPKDTINALWLFKTPEGKAYSDSPLWLEIRRPDGALVHSELLKADDSGAYRYSADIPAKSEEEETNE